MSGISVLRRSIFLVILSDISSFARRIEAAWEATLQMDRPVITSEKTKKIIATRLVICRTSFAWIVASPPEQFQCASVVKS